jgi:hypothetical protein
MNIRENIIDAVATRLAGIAIPIYKSRFLPLKTVPAIVIFANSDDANMSADGSSLLRIETIVIVVMADAQTTIPGVDGLFAVLNYYARAVETELNRVRESLSGLVEDLTYKTSSVYIERDADPLLGRIELTYHASYTDDLV